MREKERERGREREEERESERVRERERKREKEREMNKRQTGETSDGNAMRFRPIMIPHTLLHERV